MNENRKEFLPGSFTYRSLNANGAPTSGWTSGSDPIGTGYNQRIVVKGGLRVKPAGWLFPTPYQFEQTNMRYPNGVLVYRYASGSQEERRGALSPRLASPGTPGNNLAPYGDEAKARPFPDVDMLSQAESKALNGLLTHGKERDGTFSPGIAWAERRETFDLLSSTARTLAQVATDLRNGRPQRAFRDLFPNGSRKDFIALKGTPYWRWYQQQLRAGKRKLKATPAIAASAFLSLQNGWKPLLGDLQNAAEALAFRNSKADWVITGKGYIEQEVVNTDRYQTTGRNSQLAYSHSYTRKRAVFVRLDATVSDQHLHTLAQLGLNNPAALAWETTRLTYLVDYVVGIGDYLQSLGAADGLTFFSGSVTRYGEYVTVLESDRRDNQVRFSGSGRHVRWTRSVYNGFPVPIPPLSLKPKPLKVSQYFNALSVFYLALFGRRIPYAR